MRVPVGLAPAVSILDRHASPGAVLTERSEDAVAGAAAAVPSGGGRRNQQGARGRHANKGRFAGCNAVPLPWLTSGESLADPTCGVAGANRDLDTRPALCTCERGLGGERGRAGVARTAGLQIAVRWRGLLARWRRRGSRARPGLPGGALARCL